MGNRVGEEFPPPTAGPPPSRVGEGLLSLPLAGRPLHLYKEGQGSPPRHTRSPPPNPKPPAPPPAAAAAALGQTAAAA